MMNDYNDFFDELIDEDAETDEPSFSESDVLV